MVKWQELSEVQSVWRYHNPRIRDSNLGIRYKTHVQSYGWQDWKENGVMSGTTGEAKRLEAICIELTGANKDKYDVYYRVHAQTYGWLDWSKNGEMAGTEGLAKRLEAINIVIVPKVQIRALQRRRRLYPRIRVASITKRMCRRLAGRITGALMAR